MKRLALLTLCLALFAGCSSRTFSTTPRTAVEQLLLSTAVDKAMARLAVPEVEGKAVYLDFANLAATDAAYVKVAARARFAQMGATLVGGAEAADYVAELASGALAMEYKTGLIGLPATPVPNSPIPTPEVALYKTIEQTAIMKLLVFVHKEGRFVSVHQFHAKADRDESAILWWRFQNTDDVRTQWERADIELQQDRPAE